MTGNNYNFDKVNIRGLNDEVELIVNIEQMKANNFYFKSNNLGMLYL